MTAVESAQEELFGPYVVYERLGVGGMATVHRARELGIEGFERIVALKRLLPHLAEDATFIRSFVREAKLASLLHHVNLVQIFELGRVGTQYFISMEHIDGKDLRKLLRQARRHAGPPPIGVTIGLLLQLCDALDYAHTMVGEDGVPLRLVHRDVSPSNILINRAGYLKVIDFGIAKAQSSQLKTQDGRVKGKLAYMAPEAVIGRELDARSDLFAAGVIAHELLTARPLFACKNEYQTLLRVQRGDILPPSTYNRSCPPELDAIVLRALSRDPDGRFESAAAFRDELLDLRAKYQFAATHREIGSWMDWAFSVAEVSTDLSSPMERLDLHSPVPRSERSSERSIVISAPPLPVQPITPEEDELVDVAWGNQAVESGAPLALDEIPDVSRKLAKIVAPDSGELDPLPASGSHPTARRPMIAHATDASGRHQIEPTSPTPVGLGAGFAARQQPRSRTPLIAAVVGALAIAVGIWLVTRTSDQARAIAAGADTKVPTEATRYAKFTTEPVDARILIDGSEGHIGTPWKVALSAGPHQVEISREGYRTWNRPIEVEAGETQNFHVVLEQLNKLDTNTSTLRVRPSPLHFDAEVDGVPVPTGTPFEMELAPGVHRIVLRKNGVTLWRHELSVAAATTYELAPTVNERRREDPQPRERAVTAVASAANGSGSSGSADSGGDAPSSDVGTIGTTAKRAEPPIASGSATLPPIAKLPEPVTVRPAPAQPTPIAPVAVVPKPTPLPAVAVPAAPVPVAVSVVKRLSGDAPNLRTLRMDELPKIISAKICIDPKGAVSSVSILQTIEPRFVRELQKTLQRWRYAPYTINGAARSACFVVPMRTK
jgi:eukaryotic-like serine/threonine-protein kinase